jgi:hypothetical protein
VSGVELMRRGHVHGLDPRVLAQGLHGRIGARAELGLELPPRRGSWIGGGGNLDARVLAQRRQHQHEAAAHAGDADAQLAGLAARVHAQW